MQTDQPNNHTHFDAERHMSEDLGWHEQMSLYSLLCSQIILCPPSKADAAAKYDPGCL